MLGRLGDALRRRLRPDRTAPPATVPGLGSGEETALSAAAKDDAPSEPPAEAGHPPNADARFDEARDRLRSTIKPPDDTD